MSEKLKGQSVKKAKVAMPKGLLPAGQIKTVMRDPNTGRVVQLLARVLG